MYYLYLIFFAITFIFGIYTFYTYKDIKKMRVLKRALKNTQKEKLKLEKRLNSSERHVQQLQSSIQALKNAKNQKEFLQTKSKLKQIDQKKLQKWSQRVRSIGKCDICGSTSNLTAHHLWDKKTHPTLAYQDENGVCLCAECHNEFHKHYKQGPQVTPHMYQKFKVLKQQGLV